MNRNPDYNFPLVDSILHPSDFSTGSLTAFRPQPALAAAARLAARLQRPKGTFVLMHVGEAGAMPAVQCPEVPGWEWKKMTRTGDVIQGVVDTAGPEAVDLIVMSTNGRNGFLDALRGSHSERVLWNAPCPPLTVPEGSLAGGALP